MDQTFICLDPKGIGESFSKQCFNNWISFCSNKESLKNIVWINRSKIRHPIQQDQFSCGVFVSIFLRTLLLENLTIEFETTNSNLIKIRNEMFNSIVRSFLQ